MLNKLKAPVRIGVDIGGTFTDLVILDAEGKVEPSKVLTDVKDPAQGVMRGLQAAAARLNCTVRDLLATCTLFVHGSTIATNTLLEKKGAKVGLITTNGFRDSLEIRRCIRPNVWDHRAPPPPVLVPRYLRLPVVERIDANGNELERVDQASVENVIKQFKDEGVESIAICLINAYINGKHEREVRDIILSQWRDVWISCSSELAPVMGEYERSSTTVVNAYVAPRVLPYLRVLNNTLLSNGLPQDMLVVQSNGGCTSIEELAPRSVQMILSGPAAGVSSLQHYAADIGNSQAIAIEVGGTSCDVTLTDHFDVAMVDELEVDGYHLAVPAIEIGTVGAGGGTISGVDPGGLLFAGPEGAGAYPGPAAYGRGGERPTVTDAQLVLGRLQPREGKNDELSLDYELAERALRQHVAAPLGISTTDAAAGILRMVEQNMCHAVERSSIERGHNPRNFTLVAAGGAGPLHAVSVAKLLGCKSVFVPRLAGVFCAFGMCHANVRHDYQRPLLSELDETDTLERVTNILADLREQARSTLERQGFVGETARFIESLDLRYQGQQWSIKVDIEVLDPCDIRRRFNAEHERLYGSVQEQAKIEVVQVRLAGIGLISTLDRTSREAPPKTASPIGNRPVWVDAATGIHDVHIFDGSLLEPGHTLEGPAIIEEPTTTVFVGKGDKLRVSRDGNYIIDLAQ